jgi:hypothetical protein
MYYARVEHDVCAWPLLLAMLKRDKYDAAVHRYPECAWGRFGGTKSNARARTWLYVTYSFSTMLGKCGQG